MPTFYIPVYLSRTQHENCSFGGLAFSGAKAILRLYGRSLCVYEVPPSIVQ